MWVSPEKAAELLEVTVEEVLDLALEGKLEAGPGLYGGVLVKLEGPEDEGEGGQAGADPQQAGRRTNPTIPDRSMEPRQDGAAGGPSAEEKRWHGYTMVPLKEAARRLGLSDSRACALIQEGKLGGIKEKGRRWIILEDVESYAWQQENWRRLGGRWTPYGRRPKGEKAARYEAEGTANRELQIADCRLGETAEGRLEGDCWVRAEEAAAILALSVVRVGVLGREGKLVRHLGKPTDDGRPTTEDGRTGAGVRRRDAAFYLLSSVLRLAEEREHRVRGISPKEWREGPTLKPFIRSKIEAPPGDRLISRREAAGMLGVCEPRVSVLVAEGRLFGWQSLPGKPGCRLWLSERQVLRYRDDRERATRRARQRGGNSLQIASGELPNANWPEGWTNGWLWKRDHGLDEYEGEERDHGEFYSTKQAAQALGVTRGAVGKLRKRGRLQGYRAKTSRGPSVHQWWFYRKDEVEGLLADHVYQDGRARCRKAREVMRYGE